MEIVERRQYRRALWGGRGVNINVTKIIVDMVEEDTVIVCIGRVGGGIGELLMNKYLCRYDSLYSISNSIS